MKEMKVRLEFFEEVLGKGTIQMARYHRLTEK